jgi:hypothetical protein
MSETNERGPLSVRSGRWQFSLRQMFVATTGVAILLGWAAWNGWGKTDAVVYLSIAILAGAFSRAARQCLLLAVIVFVELWLTGVWGHLTRGPEMGLILDYKGIWQPALWWSALILFCLATCLRAQSRIAFWHLAASLVLVELFITAELLCAAGRSCGCSDLHEALGFRNVDPSYQARTDFIWSYFSGTFYEQLMYIVAPWLFGIAVGEIIARRRKPSGDVQHEV